MGGPRPTCRAVRRSSCPRDGHFNDRGPLIQDEIRRGLAEGEGLRVEATVSNPASFGDGLLEKFRKQGIGALMLIDAGPLVSLCDPNQPAHSRCQAVFESAASPIISTWACFVEAMYLVGRLGGFRLQKHLWTLLDRGIIRLHEHDAAERIRMVSLMDRYQNVPMDLADASLVVVAEVLGDRTIFTLDNDFQIYRLADGSAFQIIPEREQTGDRHVFYKILSLRISPINKTLVTSMSGWLVYCFCFSARRRNDPRRTRRNTNGGKNQLLFFVCLRVLRGLSFHDFDK